MFTIHTPTGRSARLARCRNHVVTWNVAATRRWLILPSRERLGVASRPATYAEIVTASDSASDDARTVPPAPEADHPVRTAAFFDLDKTVIAKSSTLAFSKPFFDQG